MVAPLTDSGHIPRAPRYVAQLPVTYRWPDGEHWFRGMTANISQSGVLFELDLSDPRVIAGDQAGGPLDLKVSFRPTPASPSKASISCSAQCVRTIVGPGKIFLNSAVVAVDSWKLPDSPAS